MPYIFCIQSKNGQLCAPIKPIFNENFNFKLRLVILIVVAVAISIVVTDVFNATFLATSIVVLALLLPLNF